MQNTKNMEVTQEIIDCWRVNYGLDKTPQELHEFWCDRVPSGATMALKVACDEIELLRKDAECFRWLQNRVIAAPIKSRTCRPQLELCIGFDHFDSTFRPIPEGSERSKTLREVIEAYMSQSRAIGAE